MIFLLSPSKALDYESAIPSGVPSTTPLLMDHAAELIEQLKQKTAQEIGQLMGLSARLSELNVTRYQDWKIKATHRNAKQAILAFNGDVYEGLNAKSLTSPQLGWAQQHLVILSGLYGVLRPFDLLQAYRLEMGTALATPRGSNLYQFWGDIITQYLNTRLSKTNNPTIINLASQEYFKVVNKELLRPHILHCSFQEYRNGGYKVISFSAKKARGLMMRFAIEHEITDAKGLQNFNLEGYTFDRLASNDTNYIFRRKQV